MKDQNGPLSSDSNDIVVEGDTQGSVTPFHKKLMKDAHRDDSQTSSAVKLAAKIRIKQKGHDKDKQKEHDKDKQKEYDKDKQKGHDKEKQKEYDKDKQKGHDKDKQKGHDKDKQKEHDKDKQKEHDKEKQVSRQTDGSDAIRKVKGHWGDVINLGRLQPSTVATILKKSVIYDNGDIVVINKPYGLPVHGGPGVTNDINALLPTLAHLLRGSQTVAMETPNLHLIHRLDKETTGVMMLARSQVTARWLHQMFFQREVEKKYWAVTVGIPDPLEGIIDIPLIDKEVVGKNRMTVNPEVGKQFSDVLGPGKKRSRGLTAVTNFRVISENGKAALVELIPETGVKHQLRVHMSQGLGCPILGDHKYSHHHKLAPQVLPKPLLRSLSIEQPKVRGLPMHLHAKQLRVPNFQDGRALSVSVKLPRFFSKTLRKLKLTIP